MILNYDMLLDHHPCKKQLNPFILLYSMISLYCTSRNWQPNYSLPYWHSYPAMLGLFPRCYLSQLCYISKSLIKYNKRVCCYKIIGMECCQVVTFAESSGFFRISPWFSQVFVYFYLFILLTSSCAV